MIKTFLLSFCLVILIFFASVSNIFVIFTYRAIFYVALGILVVVLMAAIVVTQKYSKKGTKNEEDDK